MGCVGENGGGREEGPIRSSDSGMKNEGDVRWGAGK